MHGTTFRLSIAILAAACVSDHCRAQSPQVRFHSTPGRVVIRAGQAPLATYHYADEAVPRPFLADVHAPNGMLITRPHPPGPADPQDHALMHPGIWLAFGDLNGHDYWRLKARVAHERFVAEPRGGPARGGFTVLNRYLDGDKAVCQETCQLQLRVTAAGYWILWDSIFQSPSGDFYFGDQEEMGLGVRLVGALREAGGSGRILSSEGRTGAGNTWGRAAPWCDYAGPLDGALAGVCLMAAPGNARPTWWHNRDYGFFAANLFGRQAMRQGPPSKLVVRRGETFRLRYGILIHSSPADQPVDLQQAYGDYQQMLSQQNQGS